MNQTFMKEKKILPLVLSMALPMVVSMAVNSLYNIIDSYFIAKLSEDAMTALSLVFPAQNIITSVAVGFGVGINAAIAFFLGAKEQKTADLAASQGVFFNLIHGILLTILGLHEELFVHVHKQYQCALSCFDVCQSGLFICACRHRWYYL